MAFRYLQPLDPAIEGGKARVEATIAQMEANRSVGSAFDHGQRLEARHRTRDPGTHNNLNYLFDRLVG